MNCPYCTGTNVEYKGVDVGSGEFGSSICDYYKCYDCLLEFETDCMDNLDTPWEDYDPHDPSGDPDFEGYPGHQYW